MYNRQLLYTNNDNKTSLVSCTKIKFFSTYIDTKNKNWSDIEKLVEVQQFKQFQTELNTGQFHTTDNNHKPLLSTGLSKAQVLNIVDAGMLTFLLHVESRVASACGHGFYTIGPCGEEMLGAVGEALNLEDAVALHYRHLSVNIVRSLRSGKSVKDTILDRARGYTVSSLDPVTGGGHCCLGGGENDFLVTSTLASQAPPAVGRALGIKLSNQLNLNTAKFNNSAISYVSVGDGSVNNAHFISAVNLAEYAQHRGFKCPVVFGISDNGLCISLKGYGWLDKFISKRIGMPVFTCNGNDMADVYKATLDAATYARKRGAPATVVYKNITRRFGHAATDRQAAYLSSNEITNAYTFNPLSNICKQVIEANIIDLTTLSNRFNEFTDIVESSFQEASLEPKVNSRKDLVNRNSAILAKVPKKRGRKKSDVDDGEKFQVMRKHMTRLYDELLTNAEDIVYIGEDVQHGGYYLVTENLHKKFPLRVADFPPDETTLIGAAIGYSQVGMLPILEIPYSKYLDCGGDMFFEAIISNWLSNHKQPNGMIIRLQGFDKGVFGGNFHTHNALHLPPGLDVVAYSNGADYVKGLRYAIAQARAGRIVMTVDSTDILNRRHLIEKDNAYLTKYPVDTSETLDWDTVISYGEGTDVAIVTYGNGVATAKIAQTKLDIETTVIDSPYLSAVPAMLKKLLPKYDAVVFADVCKIGQHPQAGMITTLQAEGVLPTRWSSIGACPTYNPLGNLTTFLNVDDIVNAVKKV
eukprot:g8904.t1